MENIGVWSGDETLLQALRSQLGRSYRFLPGTHPADLAGPQLALLVISPTATGLAGAGVLQSRLVLLPGADPALARAVRAASAVSYGLGRQNTLTLSSLEGGRLSVALQREVLTVSGAPLERQEWVLPYDSARDTLDGFLCRVGALLLLDRQLG